LPDYRRNAQADYEVQRKNSTISWILLALGASALIAGGVLLLRYVRRDHSQSANTATQPGTLIAANSTPTPADKLQPDPVLFPSDEKQTNTQPASPATDSSKVFSSGEVERKVEILSKPEPTYTAEARQNQINGTVVLRAVFSASGDVTDIHAVSGLPDGLTERAIAAAKQIKFVPAMKDGRPVSVSMQLQYNFNLY
jgi:TonB family protein